MSLTILKPPCFNAGDKNFTITTTVAHEQKLSYEILCDLKNNVVKITPSLEILREKTSGTVYTADYIHNLCKKIDSDISDYDFENFLESLVEMISDDPSFDEQINVSLIKDLVTYTTEELVREVTIIVDAHADTIEDDDEREELWNDVDDCVKEIKKQLKDNPFLNIKDYVCDILCIPMC